MASYLQKIIAFFMSIIAFLSGLFGLNKPTVEPEPEPSSVTEPATEPDPVEQWTPRIVTTTDVFEVGYDPELAIDRLARIGYEGIDMGFDYWVFSGSPFLSADYLTWAAGLKAHADAVGISYTHSHASHDASSTYWTGRSIQASAVIGAKYCVVHPIYQDVDKNVITDAEEFISLNAEAIRQLLPKAEECDVVILSENIPWGAAADPRIIADLVKEVDSPWFGWCFDTGHAYCKGFLPDTLTECSVVPASLHIQDSVGGDDHLIPGDGRIDWDEFVAILKAIGYTGDCVLEAHHQSLEAPDEERDAILTRLLEKGTELREKMIEQ